MVEVSEEWAFYLGGMPIGVTTSDVWCTKYTIDCIDLIGGKCE